jgi:hypothetical protein
LTDKKQIIEAIKDLDFEKLADLLDDTGSYMDVPKATFLRALEKGVRKEGLHSFERVEDGLCNACNKGCPAYKFTGVNEASLYLFLKEKEGRVVDIHLCDDFTVDCLDETSSTIHFRFHEEEKVHFSPDKNYLVNLQRIERATEEFYKLQEHGVVPVEEIVEWYQRMGGLAQDIDIEYPFQCKTYKAYQKMEQLYHAVGKVVHNYENNNWAKQALKEYESINLAKKEEVVDWLDKNRSVPFYTLKKTTDWAKTGLLILQTDPSLVVDCSSIMDSFIYNDIFYTHCNEILLKVLGPKDFYKQEDGGCVYDLRGIFKQYLGLK